MNHTIHDGQYVIALTFRVEDDQIAGPDAVYKRLDHVLWGRGPNDDPNMTGCLIDWPGSYSEDCPEHVRKLQGVARVFSVLFERCLDDDYDCISHGDSEKERAIQALGFNEALARQLVNELGDYAFAPTFSVVSAKVAYDNMPTDCIDDLAFCEEEWDAKFSGRRTAAKDDGVDPDLLAHARVLARRGKPAERGWSPGVVDEYVKTARLTAAGHLEKIAKLGVNCAFDKLAAALEQAAKYVRSVNAERVEA